MLAVLSGTQPKLNLSLFHFPLWILLIPRDMPPFIHPLLKYVLRHKIGKQKPIISLHSCKLHSTLAVMPQAEEKNMQAKGGGSS